MMNEKKKNNKTKPDVSSEEFDTKTKIISYNKTGKKTVTFIESGFPIDIFKEWKRQCQDHFNDIYWVKMWNDHLKAQAYDALISGGVQYVKETNNTEDNKEKEEGLGLLSGECD